MSTARAIAIVLLLSACGRQPGPGPAAPAVPPGGPAAAYRVNAGLAAGSIRIVARARAPSETRRAEISAGFRERNAQEAAFCDGCASRGALPDEGLLVDAASLGIRNVAASINSIGEGALAPLPPVTLDNACCRFVPHVAFAPVGRPVSLKNSDPMSHAVAISTLQGTRLFMATIPSGDKAETPAIEAAGILEITCPIHSWMRGWIIASRHPYVAITDERGEALLEKVPAGTQDLVFWHERLGTATRRVAMTAGREESVTLGDSDFQRR